MHADWFVRKAGSTVVVDSWRYTWQPHVEPRIYRKLSDNRYAQQG